jgi:hypothetical protein
MGRRDFLGTCPRLESNAASRLNQLHTTYWLGLLFHVPCLETANSLELSIPTSCRITQYFVLSTQGFVYVGP